MEKENVTSRTKAGAWAAVGGVLVAATIMSTGPALTRSAEAAGAPIKKPNIVVIWGDDVGVHNISAYNHGIMGYKTPNIDRLNEGTNEGTDE